MTFDTYFLGIAVAVAASLRSHDMIHSNHENVQEVSIKCYQATTIHLHHQESKVAVIGSSRVWLPCQYLPYLAVA